MMTEQIFEFDNLDALWNRVKNLKPGERLQVRDAGRGAQGWINEIKEDSRFKGFGTNPAKHTRPFERTDTSLFTISRDPKRHK